MISIIIIYISFLWALGTSKQESIVFWVFRFLQVSVIL